jgi:hypothetical protein
LVQESYGDCAGRYAASQGEGQFNTMTSDDITYATRAGQGQVSPGIR